MTQETLQAAASQLAASFAGELLLPDQPGYDNARKIHNGLIDKRPAAIARCRGVADIADSVALARAQGLEIAVRGGGHNVGGRATVDGGLMIDLSLMKGVYVDPVARTAVAEGGALWKHFNRETQLHGLAVTGGVVGSTGVGGLTLGGGLGWLMPKFGMALDNLEAVTLVLADGSVVRASDDSHPDLFWAVRGGGGNFGVAASFEFRLHPVGPMVFGGLAAYPLLEARQVLKGFRELAASASDDLMLVSAVLTAPDGSGNRIVAVAMCHTGPTKDAEAVAARIRGFGTVVMDALGPIPYSALNGMLDGSFPVGARNYWKSAFMPKLDDAAIEALLTAFDACPGPMSQLLLEHFHGAASRVPADATAFALRSSGFNTLVLAQWADAAQDNTFTAWCRKSFDALQPFVGPRRYLNYVNADDAGEDPASAAYGPNLPRLRQLKTKYDPGNVFHLNVNIKPA